MRGQCRCDTGGLPDAYIAMGQTAENVATLRGVSRAEQDAWGVESQNRAEKATADGFFAIRDVCSHAEVPLSDGDIDGSTLECYMHGSRFDLRTGFPLELPAISLAEQYVKPTTMLYRNMLAMETEELIRCHPVDGAVLMGGCDKTTPGLVMGALSAGLPFVYLPAGPMLRGNWKGQVLGSGSDGWKYWDERRAGKITQTQWLEVEAGIARSHGTCMTMGTAATMMGIAEAIGLTLPGASSIPAPDAAHPRMSAACGRRIVDMVWEDLTPARILSRASFDNGIAVAMAMGCSTNAIIHVVAMSRRAGAHCTVGLDDFDAASRRVPVIANIRPSGDKYLMEDFYYAGGLPALMQRLSPHLQLGALTVTGRTVGEEAAQRVICGVHPPGGSHEGVRPQRVDAGVQQPRAVAHPLGLRVDHELRNDRILAGFCVRIIRRTDGGETHHPFVPESHQHPELRQRRAQDGLLPAIGHAGQVDTGEHIAGDVGRQGLRPGPALQRGDARCLCGQGQTDGVGDHCATVPTAGTVLGGRSGPSHYLGLVRESLKTPPALARDTLRITPLGGLGDVGRNMTSFEINSDLLFVDCGVLFPSDDQPGVDLILPGLHLVEDRLDEVKALVLTHGHEDHIGAVPYLLRRRSNIPILGSRLTLAFLREKLREHRIRDVDLREVTEGDRLTIGEFDLEFLAVNHSIPDALTGRDVLGRGATGSGKTFTAVSFIYRLIKFAGAKRILFLVDRGNLGRQTLQEFQQYTAPDDGRKFTELYNVQLLTSNQLDTVSKVTITTIQRLYSMLRGEAEYDTVRAVKAALRIPVVANGDIDSPEKARDVLQATGADAVMVGRAAQGQPWIFRHMVHFLATGAHLAQPLVAEVRRLLLDHLDDHYSLYGTHIGLLSARKHIGWYLRGLPGGDDFTDHMNQLTDCAAQTSAVAGFFDALGQQMDRLPGPGRLRRIGSPAEKTEAAQ